MFPNILQFEPQEWADRAATIIQCKIRSVLTKKAACSVMLTGGRSAKRLYEAWANLDDFHRTTNVKFFFGDERCVPPNHPESNYAMVRNTLFKGRTLKDGSIYRMEGDDNDRDAAANRYAKILPNKIDVMLFGVGEDGHIASLFSGSKALAETKRRVVPVRAPRRPRERLTITPGVITGSESIFVLAAGIDKARVLLEAKRAPNDFSSLPARLVLNANWLLDSNVADL